MFVWLASYPKSGNTLVRSLLAAYFFSKDGVYNFDLIKNIKQFPNAGLFESLGLNIKNEKELIKNYVKAQEFINKKNEIQFLKTHSYLFNIDGNIFTDLNNSLGAIYIVRDPRNIVSSLATFLNISTTKSADYLINGLQLGGNKNSNKKKEFIFRMDPNSSLQEYINNILLDYFKLNTTINILDVGAGPCTMLGKKSKNFEKSLFGQIKKREKDYIFQSRI